jgi:hypothetical protein
MAEYGSTSARKLVDIDSNDQDGRTDRPTCLVHSIVKRGASSKIVTSSPAYVKLQQHDFGRERYDKACADRLSE